MKKRKKAQNRYNPAHPTSSLPDSASRSIYVSAWEAAVNCSHPGKLKKYFEDYAADPAKIIFQVDMTALSPDPKNIIIFREMKGVKTIISYLTVYMQVYPDVVTLYWQKGIKKLDHGGREIETDAHMVGTRVAEIDVVETLPPSDEDQQTLEEAVLGLASLSQAKNVNTNHNNKPEKMVSDESSSVSSCGGGGNHVPMHEDDTEDDATTALTPIVHEKMKSLLNQKKTKVVKANLDSMMVLMANENIEFQKGKPLAQQGPVSATGKFYFYLDSNKKVVKLKFVMNKTEKRAVPPISPKNTMTTATTSGSTSTSSSNPTVPSVMKPPQQLFHCMEVVTEEPRRNNNNPSNCISSSNDEGDHDNSNNHHEMSVDEEDGVDSLCSLANGGDDEDI
jgi:hypothetical protein